MKYVIERRDGGVSVMNMLGDSTPEAEIARMADTAPEKNPVAVHPLNAEAFDLTDRSFRNAWTHRGAGALIIPIEKARVLTKDRLRLERAPILIELDAYYMKALESGDKALQDRVVARKQALRDLPATVDSVATLDDLKAMKAESALDAPLADPAPEVKA